MTKRSNSMDKSELGKAINALLKSFEKGKGLPRPVVTEKRLGMNKFKVICKIAIRAITRALKRPTIKNLMAMQDASIGIQVAGELDWFGIVK